MTIKPEIKGNWNEQKAKIKKGFPALTDKDLFFEIGKRDDMLAGLLVKLGKTKEEFQQIVEAP